MVSEGPKLSPCLSGSRPVVRLNILTVEDMEKLLTPWQTGNRGVEDGGAGGAFRPQEPTSASQRARCLKFPDVPHACNM